MVGGALTAAIERSSVVREALSAARRAHAGQVRSAGNGEMPFIEHPLAVAERLAENGCPDEVLAAALLHDVVEKGGMGLSELRERFGDAVAGLVDALTEDAAIFSYEERKDEHRDRVARAGRQAQAIFAADKLVNVDALRDAYAVRGEAVDRELQVPLDTKLRTWERDLKMLAAEESGPPLVSRLADELAGLRRERSESPASSS
ncbi:MAG TPA: HD domain-containing protein [Solirubrobacterales bacterium]